MPIGVQLRPCFGATAESLPALARSWRGGGGLFFPGVSSLLFSSLVFLIGALLRYRFFLLVFLIGALCSPRALLLRCLLPMPRSHAISLLPGTAMHCDSLQRPLYSKGGCFFRKEPDVYPSSGSLAIFMPKAYR